MDTFRSCRSAQDGTPRAMDVVAAGLCAAEIIRRRATWTRRVAAGLCLALLTAFAPALQHEVAARRRAPGPEEICRCRAAAAARPRGAERAPGRPPATGGAPPERGHPAPDRSLHRLGQTRPGRRVAQEAGCLEAVG